MELCPTIPETWPSVPIENIAKFRISLQDRVVIGRELLESLNVSKQDSKSVSRNHVEIIVRDGKVKVKALGMNHPLLNGLILEKDEESDLEIGDVISLLPNKNFSFFLKMVEDPKQELSNQNDEKTVQERKPKRKIENEEEDEVPKEQALYYEEMKKVKEVLPETSSWSIIEALKRCKGKIEAAVDALVTGTVSVKKESTPVQATNKNTAADDEDMSLAYALQLQEQLNQQVEKKPQKAPTKSCTIVPLTDGVVLFKNCLSEDEQLGVYNLCLDISREGGHDKNIKLQNGYKYPVPVLYYNWPGLTSKQIPRPNDLLQFARDMFSKGGNYADEVERASKKELQFPTTYKPESLYAILYPKGGQLQSHVDGALGWVLSVSIGNSVMFHYAATQKGKRTEIRLDSGDVIIFNGGVLWHGVDQVLEGTAPPFWKTARTFGFSRFNLQFRQMETKNQ